MIDRDAAMRALVPLVKRTALAAFAREDVASLSGADWLRFLDRTGRTDAFTAGQSIVALAASAPVTRQAVTKHLDALAAAGLVRSTRPGRRRQRVWELEPRGLQEARDYLDRISRQWDDAIERLRAFVEID